MQPLSFSDTENGECLQSFTYVLLPEYDDVVSKFDVNTQMLSFFSQRPDLETIEQKFTIYRSDGVQLTSSTLKFLVSIPDLVVL
jgi:hypothetical protein